MNTLALSRYAVPQHPEAARYLLQHPDDYEYRLSAVLRTLPPPDKITDWRNFEFGDTAMYGDSFGYWKKGLDGKYNDLVLDLCSNNLVFFITDHSMEPINIAKIWPDSMIIRLINARQFQDLSRSLKNPGENVPTTSYCGNYAREKFDLLSGPDWPTWQEFDRVGYDTRLLLDLDPAVKEDIDSFYRLHLLKNKVTLFDVDNSYFFADRFLSAVKKLYDNLGFDDFQEDLVAYWQQKYMSLHV